MGLILREFMAVKKSPDNFPPDRRQVLSRMLVANQKDIKRLYAEYPEIKPERVTQLNLFKFKGVKS